jgi:hypothetical protein
MDKLTIQKIMHNEFEISPSSLKKETNLHIKKPDFGRTCTPANGLDRQTRYGSQTSHPDRRQEITSTGSGNEFKEKRHHRRRNIPSKALDLNKKRRRTQKSNAKDRIFLLLVV